MEGLLLNINDELLPMDELKNNILIYYNLENSSVINVKFNL